jgi:hypothetical protein
MRVKIRIVTEQNQAVLNSLTAKSVPAGTKNSRPVGFYSRNSTESTLHHKHNNPHIGRVLAPYRPGGRHGHRRRRCVKHNTKHNF